MPVHPKVKSSTAAAAVSGVIVWLLGRYVLHGHVDATVTAEIYAVVPALITFAAGWLTPGPKAAAPVPVTVNVTAGTNAQDAGRLVAGAVKQYGPGGSTAPPAAGA